MLNLRRSIFITFLSTNGATAIQFAVTVILSRLLTPTEIGIFSITVVFINMIAVFRDFGVSSYLQQEKNLTQDKASSAFGLLLTTSWLLATITYFLRDNVSSFYNQPGISSVIAILCISYLLVPFSAFHFAVLSRNLEAEKQAIVNIISVLAYSTTCILLAFNGFSYLSLAWANVANIATTIIAYYFVSKHDIKCTPKFSGWKTPLKFGSGAIIGNIFNTTNNAIPDLVLGKLGTAHDVGLYSRANGLVGIFQQIAGPTIGYNAIPYIAANHHQNAPLAPIFSKATSYLTGFAWPAFIVTGFFAEDIIRVLYGEKWVSAAPIAIYISAQALIRYGYSLSYSSFIAIGKPYLNALTSGVSICARALAIILVGIDDVLDFALALAVADTITTLVPAYLFSRYLGYDFKTSFLAHVPSMKLAAILSVVCFLLYATIPNTWHSWIRISIVSISIIPAWIYSIYIINHPIKLELQPILKKLFPITK